MKKHINFSNFLLLILTLAVLGLYFERINSTPDNTVYMFNSDSGFTGIKTKFGFFPLAIAETKAKGDSTELTLILINPTNIHFADAHIDINVDGGIETKTMNLLPRANEIKMEIPPINRGAPIRVELNLDKIYFQ